MKNIINKTPLKNGISLIIHTKNEENNILDCINSAKSISDEIVVIDMQSTDKTIQIAKKANARVYLVKDMGFADPARNFGIEKANYEWILSLDADERLPAPVSKRLLDIVKQNKYDVVKFPRKNLIFKKTVMHGMWWPDYQVRFFKKGYLTHSGEVHTQPKYEGRILTLPANTNNAIIHMHRESVEDFLKMVDTYTSFEKVFKEKFPHLDKIDPDELIKFLEHEFEWRYLDHKGYLDGMRGFVLSKFMSFYRFLEFAKYWEMNNFKELLEPNELKNAVLKYYPFSSQSGVEALRVQLNTITSSKFYKVWRIYCKVREKIINLGRKES